MSSFSVSLGLKTAQFTAGLDSAKRQVRQFKNETESAGGAFGGLGRSMAALGIGAAIADVVNYGDQINDLADRLDVGTESLQRWGKLEIGRAHV